MEMFIIVVITVCVILLLDKLIGSKLVLPGPKGIPLLGSLFFISEQFHLQLTSWAKKYGDIYRFRVLNQTFVVLSDYDSIYEMLVTKGKDFGGRPPSY